MDRREEIYDKALELFIAYGYDNTPLTRIARELRLTKAGLYHYVSSKEELADAYLQIFLRGLPRPRS